LSKRRRVTVMARASTGGCCGRICCSNTAASLHDAAVSAPWRLTAWRQRSMSSPASGKPAPWEQIRQLAPAVPGIPMLTGPRAALHVSQADSSVGNAVWAACASRANGSGPGARAAATISALATHAYSVSRPIAGMHSATAWCRAGDVSSAVSAARVPAAGCGSAPWVEEARLWTAVGGLAWAVPLIPPCWSVLGGLRLPSDPRRGRCR
jgi:hypothetical protein